MLGSVTKVEELQDVNGDETDEDEDQDKVFLPPGVVNHPPMPNTNGARGNESGQNGAESSASSMEVPGQKRSANHSPNGLEDISDLARNITNCSMQDLVALEFAEMERMLTTSHHKVLQLIGSDGKEDLNTNNSNSIGTQPYSAARPEPKAEPAKNTMYGLLPSRTTTTSIAQVSQALIHQNQLAKAMSKTQDLAGPSTGFDFPVAPSPKGSLVMNKTATAQQLTRFEVLQCWCRKTDEYTKAAMAGTKRGSADFFQSTYRDSTRVSGVLFDASENKNHHFGSEVDTKELGPYDLQRLVIHPCSAPRATWDTLSLLLVIYDIAFLPMQFFEPEDNWFSVLMSWVTRLFWSIDLPMSFFTGYLLSDGFIMMKLRKIAIHYLKSWFILDIMLIVGDWAELAISVAAANADTAAGEATGLGRLGKAGRVVRILRMIRLLRMARMREIIRLFTFRVTSEKVTIMADIVKCLASIIAVAHLLACVWYGLCKENTGPESWITQSGIEDQAVGYKYMLSLHWSLSQFQGGMDEFRASTASERAFNVVVFLFAFMMAAVCVSGLTSSMTRLHLLTSHQSRQISILRRYLIQNGISDKLALRVQRNALHAISEQQRLMAEGKVELLQAISDPLRVELHFEMYGPVLEVHPFFEAYVCACPHVMHHICHKAMCTLLVSNSDIIFNIGEIPENPRMYIVCNGHFEYMSAFGDTSALLAKDFLAEAALWTHWMHRGLLRALMDGRLCVMDCRRFQDIVRQFDHPQFDPRNYAVEYVKSLNERNEAGEQITDLPLGSEADLKDQADAKRRPVKGGAQLASIIQKSQKKLNAITNNLSIGGPRSMMGGGPARRQSVLFQNAGDKMPKSPKLLRFNSAMGPPTVGAQASKTSLNA